MENQESPDSAVSSSYDLMAKLHKASSDNYHHRQTYEWKMCITVWTPLIAFIGISLTYPHVVVPTEPLVVASIILLAIHTLWQINLKASNDKDAEKILEIEQQLRRHLGLSESKAPDGKVWLTRRLVFKGWPHIIYVLITCCLIILALFLNHTKSNDIINLPHDINMWLEKKPEIGSKKKDEYAAQILRAHIDIKDNEEKKITTNLQPMNKIVPRISTLPADKKSLLSAPIVRDQSNSDHIFLIKNEQPALGTLTDKFVLPFAVAVITYFLFKKHDQYLNRRQYSILGVAIIESLLEEIDNGIYILKNQQRSPLPVKSWSGMSTIPDDVLLRIIATSENIEPVSFHPKEVRIHCKNYFEHMSLNWDNAIKSNFAQQDMQDLITKGQLVDAAEGVKNMLRQCKELLESNEKRTFPA